jgi:hypothetical protein
MASYRLPLPLLAIVASLCGVAVAQRGDLIHSYLPYCSTTGNYTDGSQFKKNLKQLLSTLSSAAASNGWFQTSTVGKAGRTGRVELGPRKRQTEPSPFSWTVAGFWLAKLGSGQPESSSLFFFHQIREGQMESGLNSGPSGEGARG